MPSHADPRVLVGRESFDDAGVFVLRDDLALVQTVDFFAPIVDDPYLFGQVAAANSLSDVFAMGGEPLTAMAIVAFPSASLPMSVLSDIIRGRTEVPWRPMLLTLGAILAVALPLVFLSARYHVLGTDKVGQDVLYQSLKSIRTGLVIGTLTTLVMLPFALLGTELRYLFTSLATMVPSAFERSEFK